MFHCRGSRGKGEAAGLLSPVLSVRSRIHGMVGNEGEGPQGLSDAAQQMPERGGGMLCAQAENSCCALPGSGSPACSLSRGASFGTMIFGDY